MELSDKIRELQSQLVDQKKNNTQLSHQVISLTDKLEQKDKLLVSLESQVNLVESLKAEAAQAKVLVEQRNEIEQKYIL